jgi:CDP-glycerol glycerophosphotransferase (TagB/SpsB family)
MHQQVRPRPHGVPDPGFSVLRGNERGLVGRLVDVVVVALARVAVAGMQAIYAVLKRLPTQDKIVLMSRLYGETSQDFARVRDEVRRQSPRTRVVVLNHRNTAPWAVPAQMLLEMYHLATSRACITDSYMAVISALEHKDELIVVQMWHALGAIKRFGLAAVGTAEGRPSGLARVMRMHHGYDWVIAGGRRMVEPFAESFGVRPEQVLPIGTPRVDLLRDADYLAGKRARIDAAHPQLRDRRVVLYAPTFRTGDPVRVEPLLDALIEAELDVVVALHPLDRRDFTRLPGVTQDPAFTTLDWLTVASELITDYSAVVFDAAVLGVPTYAYAYDLDEYRERRGIPFDYEHDMPGQIHRDEKSVVRALLAHEVTPEDVERFRANFVSAPDGGSTRRIVALALGANPAELAAPDRPPDS